MTSQLHPPLSRIELTYYSACVGACLAYFRRIRGISQAALAVELGLEQTTYGDHETGRSRIRVDTLHSVLHLLGADMVSFFRFLESARSAMYSVRFVWAESGYDQQLFEEELYDRKLIDSKLPVVGARRVRKRA
jgi:transcriptional regulator with XRE-family HTH domain